MAEGTRVLAYDPQALAGAQTECRKLTSATSPYEAAEGADAIS